jgi:hypothetical protein
LGMSICSFSKSELEGGSAAPDRAGVLLKKPMTAGF